MQSLAARNSQDDCIGGASSRHLAGRFANARLQRFNRFFLAGVLIFVAIAQPAQAAQWCHGRITALLVESTGNVMVLPTFRGDWVQVCNTNASWKGVSVDSCKSWISLLTVLRVTQEPATILYGENTACGAIPSYGNAPAPGYVMIDPP